jgi:sterol desaturase/sphingolipid hydroxylase (fatty acid hydroxylase superfamily)
MQPDLLVFGIPAFAVMLIAEAWYSWKEDKHLYERNDTRTNVIIGIGAALTGLIVKAALIKSMQFIYEWRLFELTESWWVLPLVFLGADLSFYWFHRASHHINVLWIHHAVHHSSEQYNITVAFRVSWTNIFTGHVFFWGWMPLLGCDPITVFVCYQLIMLYQSWLHTKAIKRLPALLEFLFNTPSHHRVHHASNERYLDKNHGGVFIIWDRLFGTFQLEDEEAVYGLAGEKSGAGPLKVMVGQIVSIVEKCRTSGTLRGAMGYLFLRPGWSHNPVNSAARCRPERKMGLVMRLKHLSIDPDYHLSLKPAVAEMSESLRDIFKRINAIDDRQYCAVFK